MAMFKCLNPPMTVTFKHGRGEAEGMDFPTGTAKKVTCEACIVILDGMASFERTS